MGTGAVSRDAAQSSRTSNKNLNGYRNENTLFYLTCPLEKCYYLIKIVLRFSLSECAKGMWDMNQECMEYFKLLNNENKLIVLAAIREIESGCQSAPCSSHSDENKNE